MLTKFFSAIFFITFAANATEIDQIALHAQLTNGLDTNIYGGHCAARADVWAFEIERLSKQKPHKALMLYTNDFRPNDWTFHVAPVLSINGEWVVFEKANGIDRPLPLMDWMKIINDGKICEIHESVPSAFKSSFYTEFTDHWGRPIYRFDSRKLVGNCGLFITSVEMLSPGDGFLDYTLPINAYRSEPFSFARVMEMCKSLKPKISKQATEAFCKQRLYQTH